MNPIAALALALVGMFAMMLVFLAIAPMLWWFGLWYINALKSIARRAEERHLRRQERRRR